MTTTPDPSPVPTEAPAEVLTDRPWRRELWLLVGFCVVVGFVAGFVWYLVAPTPAFVPRDGRLVYRKDLPGEYIAMDGWFAVIGLVAGILVAAVVLRRGPVRAWKVLAVPLAGLAGSWVAFRVGAALGPSMPTLRPGPGVSFDDVIHGQLDLQAKGVLLVWPAVSLVILTFALAWSSREDHPKHSTAAAEPEDGADDPEGEALVGGDPDLRDVDRG